MKTMHNINKWSFIITLLLYVTFYFGLLAQILLGGTQITMSVVLLIKWKSFSIKLKKHIVAYFFLVALYGLLFFTDIKNTSFMIIYMTVIPMSIAAYFLYLTYEIKKYQQAMNLESSLDN